MSKKRGYTVVIKRSAEKEMDRLPDRTFERVAQAILKLERNPRAKGCSKLRGVQDFRLRVGKTVSSIASMTTRASSKSSPSVTGGRCIAVCEASL